MEIYSALKAAWHTRDIEAMRAGKPIVPHQLYLVISDLCNQACAFCSYRSPIGWGSENFGADTGKGFTMNPNRMIDREKAYEILSDAADMGVKAVQFTGGGEPTVHPDHDAIFAYAQDLGLQTALITNLTRLPSARVMERMTWVRVSIDAGTEETYQRTRQSKLWRKVIGNLRELMTIEGPTIGANFVTTRENYHEMGQFCRLMKEIGVPYVKIAANLTTHGVAYYDGILDEVMSCVKQAQALADGRFRIVNVFDRRLEDLRIGRPVQPFCGQQQFAGYIGADLKVYRCCNTAYTAQGEIGDISGQSYKDWLTAYRFDGFDARSCKHCQFIEKNEVIAYMVKPEPQHVEFV